MDSMPPPRPPLGGSGGALRKQALLGAHRSTAAHVPSVLEDGRAGGEPDTGRAAGTVMEQASGSGRPVVLRPWSDYWDDQNTVELAGRGSFNVYTAGDKGAVVFCLHGGGYTGLTWSLIARQLKDRYRVVAPDLRGHGATTTDADVDFSAETMTEDVAALWEALFGSSPDRVPTLLVGHSMGGALAVRAAATKRVQGLEGVVVIDIVEGTALAALPHMGAILRGRPQRFASPQAAADWAVRSGTCRCPEAAGVSFPSQVVPCEGATSAGACSSIREDEEEEGEGGSDWQGEQQQQAGGSEQGQGGGGGGAWRWRTPLEASEPFWPGWYTGLSALLLSLPVPKMLVLAGTDRLDRELTIGQMQGKFQLVLMPKAGHAIQEDEPEATAGHVASFLHRFRIGEPPLAIPRAPPSVRPVLPVVAGPLLTQPGANHPAADSRPAGGNPRL